mmetsp:Transcript_36554/g.91656  ORF Transcript_36554/g.91656 Transcript_36554/m.91656 type:complete len:246 (-) Transcript_36554:472-1209(-)
MGKLHCSASAGVRCRHSTVCAVCAVRTPPCCGAARRSMMNSKLSTHEMVTMSECSSCGASSGMASTKFVLAVFSVCSWCSSTVRRTWLRARLVRTFWNSWMTSSHTDTWKHRASAREKSSVAWMFSPTQNAVFMRASRRMRCPSRLMTNDAGLASDRYSARTGGSSMLATAWPCGPSELFRRFMAGTSAAACCGSAWNSVAAGARNSSALTIWCWLRERCTACVVGQCRLPVRGVITRNGQCTSA